MGGDAKNDILDAMFTILNGHYKILDDSAVLNVRQLAFLPENAGMLVKANETLQDAQKTAHLAKFHLL